MSDPALPVITIKIDENMKNMEIFHKKFLKRCRDERENYFSPDSHDIFSYVDPDDEDYLDSKNN